VSEKNTHILSLRKISYVSAPESEPLQSTNLS